ncbi:MAG: MBL fold metallo-hydrolase [Candidatus Methanofastidiosia archaeon]
MKITYLSHACFEFKNSLTLLIDPYFTKDNPLAPKYDGKPDLVLVTHEHFDHNDAERFDTLVVAPSTCNFKKQEPFRIGDKRKVMGVEIEMISASHHQSKYATGYIFMFEGKRVCHLGDTYIDGVKPLKDIDILLIPIGGFYTMNIDEALSALNVIKPKFVIPMHYNTFEQIKADPREFERKAKDAGFKCRVIEIGEQIEV